MRNHVAEIRLARFGHMIGLPLQLDFFKAAPIRVNNDLDEATSAINRRCIT